MGAAIAGFKIWIFGINAKYKYRWAKRPSPGDVWEGIGGFTGDNATQPYKQSLNDSMHDSSDDNVFKDPTLPSPSSVGYANFNAAPMWDKEDGKYKQAKWVEPGKPWSEFGLYSGFFEAVKLTAIENLLDPMAPPEFTDWVDREYADNGSFIGAQNAWCVEIMQTEPDERTNSWYGATDIAKYGVFSQTYTIAGAQQDTVAVGPQGELRYLNFPYQRIWLPRN